MSGLDFRAILLKYLRVVIWEEGTSFVTGASRTKHARAFSDEEWEALRALAEEAHGQIIPLGQRL